MLKIITSFSIAFEERCKKVPKNGKQVVCGAPAAARQMCKILIDLGVHAAGRCHENETPNYFFGRILPKPKTRPDAATSAQYNTMHINNAKVY